MDETILGSVFELGEQSFSPFRRYLQPEKMQEKCVVSFFFRKKNCFTEK